MLWRPNRPVSHHVRNRLSEQTKSTYREFAEPFHSYLLDVVVAQSAAILKLLTSEDKTLLIRGDTLLVLDLGLDVVDGVARLDVEGNGLTREGLDETINRRRAWVSFLISFSIIYSCHLSGFDRNSTGGCQGTWNDLHLHCRDAEKTTC